MTTVVMDARRRLASIAIETDAVTRLWHGSRTAEIERLNPSKDGWYGPGLYLTPNKSEAKKYTEPEWKEKVEPTLYKCEVERAQLIDHNALYKDKHWGAGKLVYDALSETAQDPNTKPETAREARELMRLIQPPEETWRGIHGYNLPESGGELRMRALSLLGFDGEIIRNYDADGGVAWLMYNTDKVKIVKERHLLKLLR